MTGLSTSVIQFTYWQQSMEGMAFLLPETNTWDVLLKWILHWPQLNESIVKKQNENTGSESLIKCSQIYRKNSPPWSCWHRPRLRDTNCAARGTRGEQTSGHKREAAGTTRWTCSAGRALHVKGTCRDIQSIVHVKNKMVETDPNSERSMTIYQSTETMLALYRT